ncbi:tetratricopeptide repeat protein [Amycolatopsis sp. NPDC049688]|uniref:tetratricopeptide repeat protein n=1 Tax=Amycolatopsis sp. NPDC049688 TaxID=3154733 RepID=UPI00342ECDF0
MRGAVWVAIAATLAVLLSLVGNIATNTVQLPTGWAVGLWAVVGLMGVTSVGLAVRQHRADSSPPTPTSNQVRDVHGPAFQAGSIGKVEIHPPGTRATAGPTRHRVGNLPPRADGFQARTELGTVAEAADTGATAVLTGRGSHVLSGLGGVGKTQLAAEHARTLWEREEINILVWVEAMTQEAIIAGYARAAAQIAHVTTDDAEQAAREWLDWLAGTDQQWLVVLDDLQDPADLRGLWPQPTPSGRVVVTTRRRDAALRGDGRRILEIGLFTPAEATAFLTHRLAVRPAQAEGAAGLAKALGYLPLALAQAAAYIADQPGLTCSSYESKLVDQRKRLQQLLPDSSGLPDDHSAIVTATWSMSIEAADSLSPAGMARPLLNLAALLDPNGVPDRVFAAPAVLAYLGDEVDADAVAGGLSCLHRLSLITYSPDTPHQAVRVHALLQRVVRESLRADQLAVISRVAADALREAWPEVSRDTSLSAALRSNATILVAVTGDLLWQLGGHSVLHKIGNDLGDTGQVAAAVTYFRHLATTATQQLGPDHPQTLAARHNIGYWRGNTGDLAGAVEELKAVLEDRLRVLGPENPQTLTTRHNIGYWRGKAGDPAGAVKDLEAVLKDRLRVLGPDHPDTLTARSNIARLRGDAGDLAGAVKDLEAVLKDRLRVLGLDHLSTLITRHNVAFWRGKAGDPAGAVKDLEALLKDELRILGPDHPHTLTTRSNIGYWRGDAGDLTGAVKDLEAVLKDRLRVLGPDHPDTLTTRHNLAYWRGDAGDPAGAVKDLEALLKDRLRVLGPDHPSTLITRSSIAYWHKRLDTD